MVLMLAAVATCRQVTAVPGLPRTVNLPSKVSMSSGAASSRWAAIRIALARRVPEASRSAPEATLCSGFPSCRARKGCDRCPPMTTRTRSRRTPRVSAVSVTSMDSRPCPEVETPTDTTSVPSGLTRTEHESKEVRCPVVMK